MYGYCFGCINITMCLLCNKNKCNKLIILLKITKILLIFITIGEIVYI